MSQTPVISNLLFMLHCVVNMVVVSSSQFAVFSYVFWTEWRRSREAAKIGMAYMDGSNKTYVRTSELGWPNGLTLDTRSQRLWWCDAFFDRYI